MKNLLLLLLPVLFFSFSAFPQKKYYFRHTDKNVEGTGSMENPFLSLGAFSKIKLRPGDTVFFWGGNIFIGTISLSDIHGDPHRPIVFTSYGKGKAEIHSGGREAFVITGSSD